MSDNEFLKYEKAFNKAVEVLGWSIKEIKRGHERDYACTWTEKIIVNIKNEHLIDLSQISKNLMNEIIDIADRLEFAEDSVDGG